MMLNGIAFEIEMYTMNSSTCSCLFKDVDCYDDDSLEQ